LSYRTLGQLEFGFFINLRMHADSHDDALAQLRIFDQEVGPQVG
jgi:hypothetical protein